MILLDSTIFLFKDAINPKASLLTEIDSYFGDSQIEDRPVDVNLSETTINRINLFLQKELQPAVHDYLLEFKHKDRPDLQKASYFFFTDHDEVERSKGKIYRNVLRTSDAHQLKISWAGASMVHRANMLYAGNSAKWIGNLGNLAVFIGVSNEWEHECKIHFPIQQVSVKLKRGDVLIAPSGYTHPFVVNNVINGVFKFVEAL